MSWLGPRAAAPRVASTLPRWGVGASGRKGRASPGCPRGPICPQIRGALPCLPARQGPQGSCQPAACRLCRPPAPRRVLAAVTSGIQCRVDWPFHRVCPRPCSRRILLPRSLGDPQEAGRGPQPQGRVPRRGPETGDGARNRTRPVPSPCSDGPPGSVRWMLQKDAAAPRGPRCEAAPPPAGGAGKRPLWSLRSRVPSVCRHFLYSSRCVPNRLSEGQGVCGGGTGALQRCPEWAEQQSPTVRSVRAGGWGVGQVLPSLGLPVHNEDRRVHLPGPL